MTAKRAAMLVLGMDGAGTGLMAKALAALGCGLAADSGAVRAFDERILDGAGSGAHDWLPVNPGWYRSTPYRGRVEAAAKLVGAEFGDDALFAVEDPLACRIAPFWLDALAAAEADPAVVLLVRNPIEVARLLRERDGLDTGYAQLLWLRHVLEAEAGSRGRRRTTCSHAQLTGQWEALAARMSADLGLSWPRHSPQVGEEVARLIEAEPREPALPDGAVAGDPSLSAWIRDTFAIMTRWAETGEDKSDHAALDAIRLAFDSVAPAFAGWISASGRAAEERSRAVQLDDERARLERSLQEASGQAAMLSEQVAALRQSLADTENRLRQTQEEIAQTSTQLTDERGRNAGTVDELETTNARLRDRLADSEAWVFRLATDRQAAEAETARVRSAMAAVERDRDAARADATEAHGRSTLGERQMRERHEAELAALRGSIQSGEARAQAAERRVADLVAGKGDAERRLRQGHEEVATVTRLLRASEDAELRLKDDLDWLLAVTVILVTRPDNWSLLPPHIQRQKIDRRIRRKGLFDGNAYLSRYPDVVGSGMDPLSHFIKHGFGESRINDARRD